MKFNQEQFLSGIGERMRELMEGETQMSLAEKLNVSQGNIAKYLQGKIIPRADVLWHMVVSKNVNPTWFLTGKGPKQLGAGYNLSKAKMPKVSTTIKIPYGVSKELKNLNGRMEKIAEKSPESLKEVKLFVNAVHQNAVLRSKVKK